MMNKRTIIGIIVGTIIIGIGVASLFSHLSLQTKTVDEIIGLGESALYKISAPANIPQSVKITGDSFDLQLSSPGDGLQIPLESHKNEATLNWSHSIDGETKVSIKNTGKNELHVTGIVQLSTEPIWITYDIMVMISGVIIMGFSLGFSVRKPRGF